MRYECERVKTLVREAIKQFFQEELPHKNNFSIDALIGVTVEDQGMFYVTLNEVVEACNRNKTDPGPESRKDPPDGKRARKRMRSSSSETLVSRQSKHTGEVLHATGPTIEPQDSTKSEPEDDSSQPGSQGSVQDEPMYIKQEVPDMWYDSEAHQGESDVLLECSSSPANLPHYSDYSAEEMTSDPGPSNLSHNLSQYSQHDPGVSGASTTSDQHLTISNPSQLLQNNPAMYQLPPAENQNRDSSGKKVGNKCSHKGKRCKSYNIEFKLKAVQHAKYTNKMQAARKFGVDHKRIREWCSQEEVLQQKMHTYPTERKRLDKKPTGKAIVLEKHLLEWIRARKREGIPIFKAEIRRKAAELNDSGDIDRIDGFKGSRYWLKTFLRRHNLNL